MAQKRIKVGGLQTRAAFEASSYNDERGTVEVTFTTGARGLRSPWFGERFYEELEISEKAVDLSRMNNGASVLNSHSAGDLRDVIGVVERAWLVHGEGRALIRFSDREDVKAIKADVKAGILRHISVGYTVGKYEKTETAADGLPVYRATNWTPAEISIVPIAFDDKAVVRSAESDTYEVLVSDTRGSPHTESTKMDEIQKAAEAKRVAEAAESTRAAELKAAADAGAKAERERVSGITAAVRAVKLDNAFAEKMIAGNVSLADARTAVIEELATRSEAVVTDNTVRVQITDDNRDKFVRGMSAALFERSGNGVIAQAKAKNLKEFEKVETDGGEFRGMRIVDVARTCLDRAGVSHRGIYSPERLIKMAIATRSGYHATGDFSVLFENVMHKQMRAAYAVQPHTWKRWMGVDTVSDFLTHNRFLNGSFGTLPVVGENAEYTQQAIPDGAKNSISTEKRGAIIALSMEAMINDDMGALSDVAVRFGQTAGRTLDVEAYDLLGENSGLGPTMANAQPFFHSSRANVGTTAALTVAAIDADRLIFKAQRDISSNDYLDLVPNVILVPVGLESAMKIINSSATDHTSGVTTNKPNPVAGLFSDIVSSPRAPSSGTTRRYLFAGKEAFKMVFLEGTEEGPVMESQEGFEVDGLKWKARIVAKACPYDPKTAVTNAGT